MNKKLTAWAAALAVTASMIPASTVANASPLSDFLGDLLQTAGQTQLGGYTLKDENGITIIDKAKLDVTADLQASEAGLDSWWSDSKTFSGLSQNKSLYFDYKTTIDMSGVKAEYDALSYVKALATDDPNSTAIYANIDESYIKDAAFTITVKNEDETINLTDIANKSGMEGFTAVKGTETITPQNGKLTIPGNNGDLVYSEVSRSYNNNVLTIDIKVDNEPSYATLSSALEYDLVLTCNNLLATASSAGSSSRTYTLVGQLTGDTPIYYNNAKFANIHYVSNEEKASVILTTAGTGGTGGGGYSSGTGPSNPTPTPTATPTTAPTEPTAEPTATPTLTPTYAPDQVIPCPDTFNSEEHYAYIIGYPEGDVRPENNISREEVATIFFRLMTDEARDAIFANTNDFNDVEAERWSNNAISTLNNGNYVNGYEDGTFKPGVPITRAEFVTMAVRFYENVEAETANFTDVAGHWAAKNIDKAIYYRLINGYEDGTFKPDQYIKRAEAMTIMNAILNRDVDTEGLIDEAIEKNWSDNPSTAWYYTEVFEATMSHDFERADNTTLETWTALKENRDWTELEKK